VKKNTESNVAEQVCGICNYRWTLKSHEMVVAIVGKTVKTLV